MTSILLSTLAFFIATYFIRRYLDDLGVRRSFSRGLIVFILALTLAYGVAFAVDGLLSLAG